MARKRWSLRLSLGFVSGEPQLCKMNISCIISLSRMALQQETRLLFPPSVSSLHLSRFCALFCPNFDAGGAKMCQNERRGWREMYSGRAGGR